MTTLCSRLRGIYLAAFAMVTPALGCGAPGGGGIPGNPTEIITTVRLTFAPNEGGPSVEATFVDPDGDSTGQSGMAETIRLDAGTSYRLTIMFFNELEDPAIDITDEIAVECEDHQVFLYGDALLGSAVDNVDSIATHDYDDLESTVGTNVVGDDLPVGLTNTIVTGEPGTASLKVLLRHMPPLNGNPQKVAGLAEDLVAGDALPGEIDVNVEFPFVVQ